MSLRLHTFYVYKKYWVKSIMHMQVINHYLVEVLFIDYQMLCHLAPHLHKSSTPAHTPWRRPPGVAPVQHCTQAVKRRIYIMIYEAKAKVEVRCWDEWMKCMNKTIDKYRSDRGEEGGINEVKNWLGWIERLSSRVSNVPRPPVRGRIMRVQTEGLAEGGGAPCRRGHACDVRTSAVFLSLFTQRAETGV